jgi:hypothetical protein
LHREPPAYWSGSATPIPPTLARNATLVYTELPFAGSRQVLVTVS